MVTKDIASSWDFIKFNQFITSYWSGLFLIVSISSWLSYAYFPDFNSMGHIMLSIVVPIIIIILGQLLNPYIVKCVIESTGTKDFRNKKNNEENIENIVKEVNFGGKTEVGETDNLLKT